MELRQLSFLVLLFLTSFGCYRQASDVKVAMVALDKEFDQGSGIKIDKLDKNQHQSLYKLGKIWGFVKYHHPQVAKGNVNWDYELFRIIPKVLEVSTEDQVHTEINRWVRNLGEVVSDDAENPSSFNNVKLQSDTEWIEDSNLFNDKLSETLVAIKNTKAPDEHYYIGFTSNAGNPVFKNEKTYTGLDFTDDGFKLLSVFRYWNMIEYFFPYRHLMDENWDTVLKEFVPKAIHADDELSYKLMLLELIGKIQDTHANIWQRDKTLDEYMGKNIAPIEIKIIEGLPVVTKLFDDNSSTPNIQVGDVITKINGKDVFALIEEKLKYSPASNRPTQLRDVCHKLLRTNNDTLQLSLEREGKHFDEKLHCVDISSINFWKKDIFSYRSLQGNIGYIYPGSLQKGEIDEIMKKFLPTKGLIVDMRCYPSDFIVFSLGKYLMPQPTEFVKFTFGSLAAPGQFTFGQPLKVGEENADYYKGKVVIIVNETTQSQAEYTTMALRVAPNAMVIGSTTAGADGNVSQILLPGSIRTMISGIGVYYPNGTETQRVGIVPDIEIKPTIEGIKLGKDELLEKAIALINE